jgi:hypothetical protein
MEACINPKQAILVTTHKTSIQNNLKKVRKGVEIVQKKKIKEKSMLQQVKAWRGGGFLLEVSCSMYFAYKTESIPFFFFCIY